MLPDERDERLDEAPPRAEPTRGGEYLRLDAGQAGASVALSSAAYRVHLYALTDAVVAGREGLISASYLRERGIGDGVVRELCAAGMWQASAEGYRVTDGDSLAAVNAVYAEAERLARDCVGGSGHVADEANPGFCARCHTLLGALGPESG